MQPNRTRTPDNVWANLVLIFSVVATVLLALFLAQSDGLQLRPSGPARPSPTVASAALNTSLAAATATMLPTAPLPTATSSPTITLSPDATALALITIPATPVAMLPRCGQVPAGWIAYTVRPGDTLTYLSVHSGATVSEIMQANCLERTILYSGTQLFLPAQPPVRLSCRPPGHWIRYQVQPGDTVYSLARSRGTTVYQVLDANCRTSSFIQAGQFIYLPPLPIIATIVPSPTPLPIATGTATAEATAPPAETVTGTPSATPPISPAPTASSTASPTATIISEPETPTPDVTPTPPLPATETPTLETPITPTPPAIVTLTPTATEMPPATATPTETPVPAGTATPISTDTPTLSPTETTAVEGNSLLFKDLRRQPTIIDFF